MRPRQQKCRGMAAGASPVYDSMTAFNHGACPGKTSPCHGGVTHMESEDEQFMAFTMHACPGVSRSAAHPEQHPRMASWGPVHTYNKPRLLGVPGMPFPIADTVH
eukprot:jgi/Ulvmu1/6155/UM028_0011.1